jgi:hypothetical protein
MTRHSTRTRRRRHLKMSPVPAFGVFALSMVLLLACTCSEATAQRRTSGATAQRHLVLETYEPPSQQKRVVATNPSKR